MLKVSPYSPRKYMFRYLECNKNREINNKSTRPHKNVTMKKKEEERRRKSSPPIWVHSAWSHNVNTPDIGHHPVSP